MNNTLYNILHPQPWDDKTYYGIGIFKNNGESDTIKAYSFANLYDLPWLIGNKKSYDPNISKIFNNICGDEAWEDEEKHWMYYNFDWYINQKYFQTRFNWDNFKSDYPKSYEIFNGTLTPEIFVKKGVIVTRAYFRSSLLPSYVQLVAGFKQNDTAAIHWIKRYEDTVVRAFRRDNFLFRYIKTHPDAKMSIDAGEMGRDGNWAFKEIRKYYAGIDSFDYKQCLLLRVYGNENLTSVWILLPNNTLILLQFPVIQISKNIDQLKFMNLSADIIGKKIDSPVKRVCIILDANGNVIHNYGIAFISFGRVQ